ncbi:hypothetical protein MRX96_018171 [Rhipicephalus microplus]
MLQIQRQPARRSPYQKCHGVLPVSSRTQIQPALLRGLASKEHRNKTWKRHRRTLAQDRQPGPPHAAPTPPTQPTSSEGLSLDDAGGESQDPAPQPENPDEITLSGPIDDTSVLAEHTQQIRQLLREPATAERWDDFLSILEEAVSAEPPGQQRLSQGTWQVVGDVAT